MINDVKTDVCLIDKGDVTIQNSGVTCYVNNKQTVLPLQENVYIKSTTTNEVSQRITVDVSPDREVFIYIENIKLKSTSTPFLVTSGIAHIIFSGSCNLTANTQKNVNPNGDYAPLQCDTFDANIVIQENEHSQDNLLQIKTPGGSLSAGIGTGKNSLGCNEIRILSGRVIVLYGKTGAGIGGSNTNTGGSVNKIVIEGGNVNITTQNTAPNAPAIGAASGGTSNVGVIEIKGGKVYAEGGYTAASIGAGQGSKSDYSSVGDIIISDVNLEVPSLFAHNGHYGAAIGGGYGSTKNSSHVNNIIIKSGYINTWDHTPTTYQAQYAYAAMIGGGCGAWSRDNPYNSSYVKNIIIYDGVIEGLNRWNNTGAVIGAGRGGETDNTVVNTSYVDLLYISGGRLNLTGGKLGSGLGYSFNTQRDSGKVFKSGTVENLIIEDSRIPLYIRATSLDRPVFDYYSNILDKKPPSPVEIPGETAQKFYLIKNFNKKGKFKCDTRGKVIYPNTAQNSRKQWSESQEFTLNECIFDNSKKVASSLTFTGFYHLFNPYRNPIYIMIIAAGFYTTFFYA